MNLTLFRLIGTQVCSKYGSMAVVRHCHYHMKMRMRADADHGGPVEAGQ